MSFEKPRRYVRIPLYVRVEARGERAIGTAYSWNISEGGLYLKAREVPPEHVPIGTQLAVTFQLPHGPVLSLQADVVWVDSAVHDHGGVRATGIGLRFKPGQEASTAVIHDFIQAFRYRAVALRFPQMDVARQALEDLYLIDEVASEEELRRLVATGQVGLLLIGPFGNAREESERLNLILSDVERQPPIVYMGRTASPELETLISKSGRLVFKNTDFEVLELRTLAQRLVEVYVLAFENQRLTSELERALERLRRENQYLKGRIVQPMRIEGLIGDSAAMRRVYDQIDRVAPLSTTVMISGETGTGKDLVARAIHALSPRSHRQFVSQNCAAIAETLLDSELFGHVRGAFTGAVSDHPGLFESADGGTIFLDEVGEMPLSMQAKLLTVLQNGELRRVGSMRTIRVDVRVLCATHRDMELLVKERRFREDLFYRVRAFVLPLPPLRERLADIPVLAMHFLERFTLRHGRSVAGITSDAMRKLEEHTWPGNVRELEHTMERLVVSCPPGAKIDAVLVREALGLGDSAEDEQDSGWNLDEAVFNYERQLILAELERNNMNLSHTARALRINRTTLSKRCKRFGLTVS